MSQLGDYNLSTVLYTKFTTVNASGVPTTLGDAPTFAFYQDANTTAFTAGLTGTVDFNSQTGLNHVQMTVTTSATGIAAGSSYQIVVATGSVSGVSLKGYVVGEFSVLQRSPLRPTTAGRTLLVNASGATAIDWGAVSNPGSTVGLSATTIFVASNVNVSSVSTVFPANVTSITTVVNANVTSISTVVAANVTSISTVVNANVTSISTVVNANVTSVGASALTAIQSGLATPTNITAGTFTTLSGNVNGNVGGNVTGSVGSVAAGGIAAASFAANAIDSSALAATAVAEIWNTALTESYNTDGSAATGAQLLYGLTSFLFERSIVSTTLTAKKLDGSTTAMTFTLDSTTPTSITRST